MAGDQQDIEALRERLRALGYLDAPVDRFVLGSAASRGGALRFALGAGLRVGLIAGLLLGLSSAVALAVRAPGFIATRRDAVVMAAALVVLFTIVTAIAVTATALVAGLVARRSSGLTAARARAVAAAAGIIVALGCAAYLTLWWNAAQDVLSGLTFAWNLAALAIAAIVALLLAHAVSVVVLAALARRDAASDIRAGGLLSSRVFLVAFGVLLFAGSAALLASGVGRHATSADAEPITVTPTGYALRVIAIDGVDAGVVAALGDELDTLSRLLRGARMAIPRSGTGDPDPARDWTTIATGQPPAVHGIESLEARRALGMEGRLSSAAGGIAKTLLDAADLLRLTTPAVATGEERRAPAFWEVAAAAGLRTAVINWWATWPAPAGDDIVLTDRAMLRLDTGGALDAEIAPASLYEPLRQRWAAARASASARAREAFASIANAELRAVMQRSAEIDLLTAALARVNPGGPLDLQVVYFAGLDIAQFQILQGGNPASVAAMNERVAAIETYYRFLDDVIGPLLAPSPSQIDVAILWPGRTVAGDGTLAIAGEVIRTPALACEDCERGVAPTLLYLLGLPIAADLAATAETGVATDAFRARHPVRTIRSYEAALTRPGARTGQPLDAEALERLRSLGYIR